MCKTPQVAQSAWITERKGAQEKDEAEFCSGTLEFGLSPKGDREISGSGADLHFYHADTGAEHSSPSQRHYAFTTNHEHVTVCI